MVSINTNQLTKKERKKLTELSAGYKTVEKFLEQNPKLKRNTYYNAIEGKSNLRIESLIIIRDILNKQSQKQSA